MDTGKEDYSITVSMGENLSPTVAMNVKFFIRLGIDFLHDLAAPFLGRDPNGFISYYRNRCSSIFNNAFSQ